MAILFLQALGSLLTLQPQIVQEWPEKKGQDWQILYRRSISSGGAVLEPEDMWWIREFV
jgi:hypothetical protein